jgi:hypothetical protein
LRHKEPLPTHRLRNSLSVFASLQLKHSFLVDKTAYDVARKAVNLETYPAAEMVTLYRSWDKFSLASRKLLITPSHHCKTQLCCVVDFFQSHDLSLGALKIIQNLLVKFLSADPRLQGNSQVAEIITAYTSMVRQLSEIMA